jgi:hypothetical protein
VIREGGVVEVHATGAQAQRRVRQLDAQVLAAQELGFDEGGQPLAAERRILAGPVLLRLTGALPARAHRGYAAALARAAAAEPALSQIDATKEAPCST